MEHAGVLASFFLVCSVYTAGVVLVSWTSREGIVVDGLPPCKFPAIYNFGDSNSDTGGISAAFYPTVAPYGKTHFHKPVGRASDGRLLIDFIAEHLNLPYLSAYLDSIGTSFRYGANFATGGSTIRRQGPSVLGDGVGPFSLDIQIANFKQFRMRTTYYYEHAESEKQAYKSRLPRPQDFSQSLYIFDIGQNDMSAVFRNTSVEQLNASIPDIVDHLAIAIQDLYQQGARSFWIHNIGPLGCLAYTLRYAPSMPDYLDKIGCFKHLNDLASEFNKQLKQRVIQLRNTLTEAALTYVDVYSAKYQLMSNPEQEGFERKEKICCGFDNKDTFVWCGQKADVNGSLVIAGSCEDPSTVINWDGVHFTDAANRWIAKLIANGSLSDLKVPLMHACQRL